MCCKRGNINRVAAEWFLGIPGGGVSPEPVLEDFAFYLDTHSIQRMFADTSAPADVIAGVTGNKVGLIYEGGNAALVGRTTTTNTNWPELGSDATRNSYLTSKGNGFVFAGRRNYWRPFHAVSPSYKVQFFIKMESGTDGVYKEISSTNNSGSTTTVGMTVSRAATNKLNLVMCRASAGSPGFNFSTTQNINVSAGWVAVQFDVNGTGATAGRCKINNDAIATFSVAAGVNSISSADLRILHDAGYSISEFRVKPGTLTADEMTEFLTLNPAQTTEEFTPRLRRHYDFNDTTKMFSDAGQTTPVTNGSIIRRINDSVVSLFGDLERYMTSAADASAPVYRASVLNGKGAVEYNGLNTQNLAFDADITSPEMGLGKFTFVLVVQNRDANRGSHLLTNDNYMVLTGSNYNTGGSLDPYVTVHLSDATSPSFIDVKSKTDGFNVIVFQSKGRDVIFWNGLKQKAQATRVTGTFGVTQIGFGFTGSVDPLEWAMDGYVCEFKMYAGVGDDDWVEGEIDRLNLKYNL